MIVGRSSAIQRALALTERYAQTRLSILLLGATGTGKELFAQHIHRLSRRRGSIVDLNCGALPRDMVESLLFGHRRGAFTGAVESTQGYFTRADNGTLFFDEVTSLACDSQVKVLRVLETGEVEALGADQKRPVDVRVVAAAQDDLPAALDDGRFRRDLYQRLAGVVIELPPLAARPEDVVPLAEYFVSLHGWRFEQGVERVLLEYSWPGNVRELRLVIERAGEMAGNGTLRPGPVAEAIDLGAPRSQVSATQGQPLQALAADRSERERLTLACRDHGWDTRRAAAALGIARATLYRRLRAQCVNLRALRARSPASENSQRILT